MAFLGAYRQITLRRVVLRQLGQSLQGYQRYRLHISTHSASVESVMRVDGRANADEMAASLQELGTMQTTAAELRGRILDVDSGLSRVGKAYLHHLTDWQEHSSITASLTQSLQVLLPSCHVACMHFTTIYSLAGQHHFVRSIWHAKLQHPGLLLSKA